MDLVFREVEGKYVAEFTATSDFNLHIEREGKGSWHCTRQEAKADSMLRLIL